MGSPVTFQGLRLSRLDPSEFEVDLAMNLRYVEAMEGYHPRYVRSGREKRPVAHPAVLLNRSSNTRSPSYSPGEDEPNVQSKAEVYFTGPAHVGEKLATAWRYVETYQKRGRTYIVIESVVRNEQGRQLLRFVEHGTLLSTRPGKSFGRSMTSTGAAANGSVAQMPHAHDTEIGMVLYGRPKHVTLDRMRLFSGPGRNIHTDEDTAREAGLSGPVAAGTQMIGHICEMMIDYFGEEWLRGGTLRLTVIRSIFAGDFLDYRGLIVAKSGERSDVQGYMVDLRTLNQTGELVSVGRGTTLGAEGNLSDA